MASDKATVVLMSEEVNETIVRACSALFPIVKSSEAVFSKVKVDLPGTFAECNPYQVKEVLNRAYTAIGNFETSRTAEAMKGVRGRVDAILEGIKASNLAAQEQIKALPESVRKHLDSSALRDWVGVPVSELLSAFPEGTPETQATVFLKDLNYKLVQGKTNEGVRVRLVLREAEGPKPPTASTEAL
jgi:hypothetical protein